MAPTKRELILAALVFAGIVLLGEATLRLARVSFEPQLYGPNRELGWKLRPGASGVVRTETPQFVRINAEGYRDTEHQVAKPAETLRIAVLGNSWTEALQVPQEKTYTALLENELNERGCFGGKRVEVLNFGVAGYSTAQELLTLQQEVWKYRPDMVLLAFYPPRDIANNTRALNNAANPEQSPYFVYRDGQLVEDDSFQQISALQPGQMALQKLGYEMNKRSKLLQAINAARMNSRMRMALAGLKEKAERAGVENLEYAIYGPPTTSEMQDGWKVTEGLLVKMRDDVRTHGAELSVLILATRPQVMPNLGDREALAKKLGVRNLSYAEERLKDICAKEGIAAIALGVPLAKYAADHHVYLNGFNARNFGQGHWNETGHAVAAAAIANVLCAGGGARAAK